MTDAIGYELLGDIAVLTAQNPPVNALGYDVRTGLWEGIERAEKDGARAVLIYGDGATFFAGADIKEFGKPPKEPYLPDLCTRIEASPLIVVSSMHGTALGGGLEIALGSHYRIAVPSARMGLPEVLIGVMPGAGGTQRLPRLIGVERSLDIITSGRQIGAREALDLGIIDRIEDGAPRDIGLAYARELLASGAPRRAISEMPAPEPVDFDATYEAVLKKGRGQLSPAVAVRGVQAACELPFAEGMKRERELFMELMATDQRQGLIHAFFAERAVGKLPELEGVDPRPLAELGVIGGGTMGAGIATAALLSGLGVIMLEMSAEAAQAARGRIEGNLQGALKRGKIDQAKFDHLTGTALRLSTDYDALKNADLVIEAVFEDMEVKKQVFGKLDAVCKPGAVLATNTSYLDVNEIAAITARPADVIGLHFFSPAHVMKLLEIVVADKSAPDVVATGFALGKRLGKVSVRAGVCDGFIGNRILARYREAADTVMMDGSNPWEVDAAMVEFGYPMGPYEAQDLSGLDIAHANRRRQDATRDPARRYIPIADRMVAEGRLGKKVGVGWYRYPGGGGKVEDPLVEDLVREEAHYAKVARRAFTGDEIRTRLLIAMINEAAAILDEGIALSAADIDLVTVAGYGFPRWRGGLMHHADTLGPKAVLEALRRFAVEDPVAWKPAALIERLAAEGKSFAEA
ncbi:MAG: enoyl-CoA hydratase/isomerase family protein [Maritimibacter sp.]|nr:enoyl-CoA hydratase/isomerase family protein [Maritimibacter sp.]